MIRKIPLRGEKLLLGLEKFLSPDSAGTFSFVRSVTCSMLLLELGKLENMWFFSQPRMNEKSCELSCCVMIINKNSTLWELIFLCSPSWFFLLFMLIFFISFMSFPDNIGCKLNGEGKSSSKVENGKVLHLNLLRSEYATWKFSLQLKSILCYRCSPVEPLHPSITNIHA